MFDELEEMEKWVYFGTFWIEYRLYELEKEKVKILEEEIQKINENYENSKAKYVKLLVGMNCIVFIIKLLLLLKFARKIL